jgi:CRP/FNR family cyclic AMP-dependent transcriptional regulator
MSSIHDRIREYSLFSALDAKYVKILDECASEVSMMRDQIVFRHGEQADHFYIIEGGRISLDIAVPGRGIIPVQTIHAGEVLGWSWIFQPYQWQFDARALEESIAISFDAERVRFAIDGDHEFGFQMMIRFSTVMMERLQATRLRLVDMYGMPV